MKIRPITLYYLLAALVIVTLLYEVYQEVAGTNTGSNLYIPPSTINNIYP